MIMSSTVQNAVRTAKLAYVASADENGAPHVALSRRLKLLDPSHILFADWFCPKTLANIMQNPQVSVIIPTSEAGGYQLACRVAGAETVAVADGWTGAEDAKPHMPQEERQFTVCVEAVMEFRSGLHTDEPIEVESGK